jgi:hypothetical protein
MVQPLHIKNAHIWDGSDKKTQPRDLYTTDVIVERPAPGALVVDLEGYTIFPGLINAHDHLELNHYPRSKFREVYNNAHEWGEDMNARLDSEPYKSLRAYPLWDRLFIGGLKNLLCGATTVAHHNPPHKALFHKDFPVRVLKKYGWAHSLHFSTDEEIVTSYRSTPKDVPWFIHLAEGTDEVAAGEYQRLKALGCIDANTVFIHGVGITADDVIDACAPPDSYGVGTGLVWCPSTNFFLLNTTVEDGHWLIVHVGNMILGSDSRLTADGDLLDEMRLAAKIYDANEAMWMVSGESARILRMKNIGHLNIDAKADVIAIKTTNNFEYNLCNSHRADLALVVKGGVPQIGDPDMMAKFPHIQTVPAILDGKPKAIHRDLARRILQCKLKEPGLEVDALPERKFRLW